MNEDRSIVTCKEVKKLSSSSLGVFLTKELKLAGIDEGDFIEVTIRKIKGAGE